MPTSYTGVEANVPASRADTNIIVPVDGDPRNAASINTSTQRLVDYLQRIVKKAGFVDLPATWTAAQTFNSDGAGWQALTLASGWSVISPDPAVRVQPSYRVDSFGRVWMRGTITRASGTNRLLTTLPSGARPPSAQGQSFVVASDHASGQSHVRVAGVNASGVANPGEVQLIDHDAGSNTLTELDLSAITFYVNGK